MGFILLQEFSPGGGAGDELRHSYFFLIGPQIQFQDLNSSPRFNSTSVHLGEPASVLGFLWRRGEELQAGTWVT